MREKGGDEDLVEDPDGVVVSATEELVHGLGISGGEDFWVVDDVFAEVLGVVRPGVFRQPPHQPQDLTVDSRPLVHLPSNRRSTAKPS